VSSSVVPAEESAGSTVDTSAAHSDAEFGASHSEARTAPTRSAQARAVPTRAVPVFDGESPEGRRERLERAAVRINSNPTVRGAARVGLGANALVHGLIGALAIGVASGYGGQADQAGALDAISQTPGGFFILWSAAVALGGLALWQFSDAAFVTAPARRTRVARRIGDMARSIGFLSVGAGTLIFAVGGRSDNEAATYSVSEKLLGTPWGITILLLSGLLVGTVGGTSIYRGVSRTFRQEVAGMAGVVAVIVDVLGVLGYVAKGFALLVVGLLAVLAVIHTEPNQAGGLDGALKYLATLPSGSVLLDVVGAGFISYALYLIARAIYLPRSL
jgi:hypothetical protein